MKNEIKTVPLSNIHINFYNNMLKETLNKLCTSLSDTIKLAIIIFNDENQLIYPDNINLKSISTTKNWFKSFLFNDISIRIICYAEDAYSSKMGNSLYDNESFPVFDLFMERILTGLTKIISEDLAEGYTTSYWEANYIPLQSVIDFLDCKDLPLDVNSLTYISSLSYESVHCTGKIIFVDNYNKIKEMINTNTPILQFEEAIYIKKENCQTIRKLLEIAQNKTYLLAFKFSNSMAITGIAYDIENERILKNNYILEFCGHMFWRMKYNSMVVFEYKNGCYYIADDFNPEKNYQHFLSKHFKNLIDEQEQIKLAKTLITEASKQKHGAIIIISDHAAKEAKRLCSKNRGVRVSPPFDILKNKDIIYSVTSIDGAILLDESYKCHAIGVILDGIAEKGDVSRGSRYNSTHTYVKWVYKKFKISSWAIVISEDCMVNIIEA